MESQSVFQDEIQARKFSIELGPSVLLRSESDKKWRGGTKKIDCGRGRNADDDDETVKERRSDFRGEYCLSFFGPTRYRINLPIMERRRGGLSWYTRNDFWRTTNNQHAA